MTTDDKPVRSIHADNLACLAPRAASTHKGPLGHALVITGDVGGTGLLGAQTALYCGAASNMYDSTRLLFEEHSPCQA